MDRIVLERTKYNSYADTAALVAANQIAGITTTAVAVTNAKNAFNANALQNDSTTITTVDATVTDGNGKRTVNLKYTVAVKMSFMGLIGFKTANISGGSTVISGTPLYSDFYVLLDNSPSMGLAATKQDITNMEKLTSKSVDGSCAFACHVVTTTTNKKGIVTVTENHNSPDEDFYPIATTNGVTLRIDTVKTAVSSLLDTAITSQSALNHFQFSLYNFGKSAETAGLNNFSPLSSSLATLKADATDTTKMALMTVPYQNYNSDTQTDLFSIWRALNIAVPKSGDGSTLAKSKKYVFFVSDGVNDSILSGSDKCSQKLSGTRCQAPIDATTLCQPLKDNGTTVVVIYTSYLPPNYPDGWYNSYVGPYNKSPYSPSPNSLIAQNMEACASPGFYKEVGPGDPISDVLSQMFLTILAAPRIAS